MKGYVGEKVGIKTKQAQKYVQENKVIQNAYKKGQEYGGKAKEFGSQAYDKGKEYG